MRVGRTGGKTPRGMLARLQGGATGPLRLFSWDKALANGKAMRLDILKALNAARRERSAAILVTDTATGEERLVAGDKLADDPLAEELRKRLRSARSGMLEDGRTFLTVQVPPPRLVAIGAVHISQALAPMAKFTGLDVTIIDPRTAFATPERFPEMALLAEWPEDALKRVPLDPFTALVALTHDPKIDDLPLLASLEAGCFYVGALGSRKTHARRVERLLAAGADAASLETIHAPIGIDIGAQSPAEIAVAILAEMIAALRRGRQAGRIAA
jgi:xanthine dehydrogenase accessory factor